MTRYFQFGQRGTNFRTEIIAGATTFLSMMYIVIVNSSAFNAGGMDFGGVYIATIIATVVATLIMGVAANYPIAIAPGLGINAYLVFVVILSQGVSWQQALGAAAIAAGIFTLLSLTQFREMFINSIPESLKKSIAAGIGLFIALIGLRSGGIVVDSPATLITLGDISDPALLLTVVGLIITMILIVLNVTGAIFIGMVFTAIASYFLGYWTLPDSIFAMPSGFDKTFMQLSFEGMPSLAMTIFTILLVTLFDTTGTMLGVGQQAGLIRDGKFPNLKSALLADSIGSFVGAFAGTGPTSAFVESGTGVSAGGRTGFASVVTAVLFLALLFLQPIAAAIASIPAITAPALILTGCFMVADVANIEWDDYSEAFPAFLTMVLMPMTYSITNGVGIGMMTYVILKIATGRFTDVHPLLAIMAVLFVVQMV
ncbi:MAG: NCS2 family permease [Selenomonadaceae bacterium]|nr:NCS2 family permease [Selenomonadaceae bacterium]